MSWIATLAKLAGFGQTWRDNMRIPEPLDDALGTEDPGGSQIEFDDLADASAVLFAELASNTQYTHDVLGGLETAIDVAPTGTPAEIGEKYLKGIKRNTIEKTWPDGATDPNKMISTLLWDESWGLTGDDANVIDGGPTKQYHDLCVVFDNNNNPQLLALDRTFNKIEVYNPRSKALLDTSSLLTDDLTPTPPWLAASMCTDGTYVYVGLFQSE